MKRYYANLLGNWTDITDSGTIQGALASETVVGQNLVQFPSMPSQTCFGYDFVLVEYDGRSFWLHPSCIQIVEE